MISLRDVTVAYGSQVVLDGVDLDICDGETLAILGASGSGKSTILRLIIGLQKPTRGRIFVELSARGSVRAAARRKYRQSSGKSSASSDWRALRT